VRLKVRKNLEEAKKAFGRRLREAIEQEEKRYINELKESLLRIERDLEKRKLLNKRVLEILSITRERLGLPPKVGSQGIAEKAFKQFEADVLLIIGREDLIHIEELARTLRNNGWIFHQKTLKKAIKDLVKNKIIIKEADFLSSKQIINTKISRELISFLRLHKETDLKTISEKLEIQKKLLDILIKELFKAGIIVKQKDKIYLA